MAAINRAPPAPLQEPRAFDVVCDTIQDAAQKVADFWHYAYYLSPLMYFVLLAKFAYKFLENTFCPLENRVQLIDQRRQPAVFNQDDPFSLVQVAREYIQSPGIADIEAPEIGMDPSIDPRHLSEQVYGEPPVEDAPMDANLRQLPALFQRFVTELHPNHPDLIDEDTPATLEELQAGIENLVTILEQDQFPFLRAQRADHMIRHVIHLLTLNQAGITDQLKAGLLIELAKGGHRGCPTRIMEGAKEAYDTLMGRRPVLTIPEQIAKVLHDARLGIFREKSRAHPHPEDIQVYQEYILSLRDYLGISPSIAVYNDHLLLTFELDPKYSLPDFFQSYTPEFITEIVTQAVNGFPREGRPAHERAGVIISTNQLFHWFLENPLANGHAFMDRDTYTFTEEAVQHMLVQMRILRA